MKRMNAAFAMMAMAAALSPGGGYFDGRPRRSTPVNLDTPPPTPPIPKGCKMYHFSEAGELLETNRNAFFSCAATNLKNAKRKFQNFKNSTNA